MLDYTAVAMDNACDPAAHGLSRPLKPEKVATLNHRLQQCTHMLASTPIHAFHLLRLLYVTFDNNDTRMRCFRFMLGLRTSLLNTQTSIPAPAGC